MVQPRKFRNFPREEADIVLYETAREVAVKVLNKLERTDSYLDKLLDFELRTAELSRLDKSFLIELVNGTVRWKARLDYVISKFYRGDYAKLDINVKNAVRIAMYQVIFLERVPQSAAVNEAVEFVKKLRGQFLGNLVNAVLRTSIRKIDTLEYPLIEEDPVFSLSVVHSFPQWLVRRFVDRFGVYETEQLLISLNDRPRLSIRVNPRKTSTDEMEKMLQGRGLHVSHGQFISNFLYVDGLTRIGEFESYRAGQFTVQDESAGVASLLLDPKPGDRILDMCSAPGAKTTHILELTNGEVDMTAVEKYDNRARLVSEAVERMGYNPVKIVAADATKFTDAFPYDKILIDAPSTGFGAIRKKPDSKWKRESEDIVLLNGIQTDILENAAKLLKPGGVIVYSTSTIETDENQEVVKAFIIHHPDCYVESAEAYVDRSLVTKEGFVETFPHRHDMDGSFAARIRKSK